ncbi:interferon-inducible GTPase 5-like [Misgurnus anguillicaudatus]|uniref:interferon-inducible GTPase 5-like n=1 Tax=Misgurnus anguillicaudatus TaxID=75329 RepID=UPI003CCF6F03
MLRVSQLTEICESVMPDGTVAAIATESHLIQNGDKRTSLISSQTAASTCNTQPLIAALKTSSLLLIGYKCVLVVGPSSFPKRFSNIVDSAFKLNIAVTGESGSGKSTFVNAFRGLGDEDEGSAKTGVVETTMNPEVYHHPKYKNVKMWDLPGIGTPNFKANEYLQHVKFECYDFFIIIASDRFRECHAQLAIEIMRMRKKFYFVRSKIDVDINAEKNKKTFDQEKTLETIRQDCNKGLKAVGVEDPVVFLISGYDLGKYDFNLLHERIEKELPQLKRHVLLLAVPNITLDIIEKKKKALKKNIVKVAFLSAAVAAVPLPGLSIVADLVLVKDEISRVFGLDRESLKRFCEQFGHSIETVNSLIESVWVKGCFTESLIDLLSATSLFVTAEAVGQVFACIPVIGSLVAGGLSFTAFLMLQKVLNEIAKDARKLLHLKEHAHILGI